MSRRERQAGLERCEKQIRWAIDYHRAQFRGRDDGSLSEAQIVSKLESAHIVERANWDLWSYGGEGYNEADLAALLDGRSS